MKPLYFFTFLFLFLGCSPGEKNKVQLSGILQDLPSIEGRPEYITSPYVTAGDRVYMVGHQDGSFQEIGWHIKGEMGGIWNHPVKLMDGFSARLIHQGDSLSLEKADRFVNYPMANVLEYYPQGIPMKIQRFQVVPDGKQGIIIQYLFSNSGNKDLEFDFEFTAFSDLRPTWLGEETGMHDSLDIVTFEENLAIFKDQANPWFSVVGSESRTRELRETHTHYSGQGAAAALVYPLKVKAGEEQTLNLVISGSYNGKEQALETFNELRDQVVSLVTTKKKRYQQLASRSELNIPDSSIAQAFEWLKYNSDWLVRTVPEIGTGITAGIPDYPWWFGVDSEYALKGYMAIGQWDPAFQTISLLDSVSGAQNGNGRIIHEMSTNGKVFNPGNINETPQFASLIWETFLWTGDREFLEKYYPTVKKGLAWLMDEKDTNKNLFPDGFGMMEIHGMDSEMIDVAVYTQRAFGDAAQMAVVMGDTKVAAYYRDMAEKLKTKINNEFWSEEFKSYADFIGTDDQALRLIKDAIIRADTLNKPWAIDELKRTAEKIRNSPSDKPRPFVLHHNWVVNTPMEMKVADSLKAIQALQTAEKFVNPYGVFVTGIDRDESAGKEHGSFKGSKVFSYTGAVMTLPTGVQAIAENNYGRPEKALDYLKRMTRTFSYALPGSMYEVSPDYGMIVQAWNIYSFAIPIVQQFFGVRPRAHEKLVKVTPRMPETWSDVSLQNVAIGDNTISVYYTRKDSLETLTVTQENPGWTIELSLPGPGAIELTEGTAEPSDSADSILYRSKSQKVTLRRKIP
ncbi:glycogen debranching protein [Zeaxanthinibacter sp. PT1]|uniref:alpha-L-rhamnosidase-related protein n=1 Tax=Zeaxanthinibacter TaxID=561554 RepID=UPI002349DF8D|nr:glycogen debranching protein [Zeaxanthinibacter sp. PT1]MDC6351069.1 glycogen debranching protein [Zeaxanthinibacter sp. PT1]